MNKNIKRITYISILTTIMCIISPISIQIGVIPITLSTFIIYIIGSITKPIDSIIICLLYIFIGFIGFPVFSSYTGGIASIIGPTGGYIIGYLPCVILISIIINLNKRQLLLYIIGIILGTICCYLFGSVWYMIYTDVTIEYALLVCIVPFIIFDAIKIIIAIFISYLLNNKTDLK